MFAYWLDLLAFFVAVVTPLQARTCILLCPQSFIPSFLSPECQQKRSLFPLTRSRGIYARARLGRQQAPPHAHQQTSPPFAADDRRLKKGGSRTADATCTCTRTLQEEEEEKGERVLNRGEHGDNLLFALGQVSKM